MISPGIDCVLFFLVVIHTTWLPGILNFIFMVLFSGPLIFTRYILIVSFSGALAPVFVFCLLLMVFFPFFF